MAIDRRTFIQTTSLAALGSLLTTCSGSQKVRLKKGDTIAVLGDSITATKDGYVHLLQEYVNANHPTLALTFLNWGKSSETITGLTEKDHPGSRPYLLERLDTLLDKQHVDLIFFCYGINCGIYGEPSPSLFDSYTIGVRSFIQKIKNRNIPSVLLTPPPLVLAVAPKNSPNQNIPYGYKNPYPKYEEEVLLPFTSIIQETHHTSVLGTIDIHTPLWKHREVCYNTDPIHPNANGHQVIMDTIVNHLTI